MRAALRTALFIAVSVGLARPALADPTASYSTMGPAAVGKPAPWMAAWTVAHEPLTIPRVLKQQDVDKIAIVFFATWCKPCRAGLEMLIKAAPRFKQAHVQIVLLAYQQTEDEIGKFADEHGLGVFTVGADKFGEVAESYGVVEKKGGNEEVQLPRTFVISRKGDLTAIFGAEGPDYVDRIIQGR